MKHKTLYLGLDPSRFVLEVDHVPFIQIVPYPLQDVQAYFQNLAPFSDVLLTSRSAVLLFVDYARKVKQKFIDKQFFVVGQATASLLREFAVHKIFVAQQECSEGVCSLLQTHRPTYLFYPHAQQARDVISTYLKTCHLPHVEFALYHTQSCVPQPLPCLQDYERVVFTSPSTVKAFFACYASLPLELNLLAIGPVTKQALTKALQDKGLTGQIHELKEVGL